MCVCVYQEQVKKEVRPVTVSGKGMSVANRSVPGTAL